MVMAEESVLPHWMDAWLQLQVYESKLKCRKHPNKYETVFCCGCMGKPLCEVCWKNSTEHKGHQSLQVYQASRRTAIEDNELAKLWDASDIQKYSINNKFVYYLNPHAEGAVEDHKQDSCKCVTCKRRLMESKNKFCSVACKCKKARTESVPTAVVVPPVKKKSRRKGIPHRAPFF